MSLRVGADGRAPAAAAGQPAPLEQWYRDWRDSCTVDISSSGVPPLTVAEACELIGLRWPDLGAIVLDDSDSLGAYPLRAALAETWGDGDPSRVLAAQGSNEVIFLVMHALLEPGDDVVVTTPMYHAYLRALRDRRCRVHPWQLRAGAGFHPDIDELDRLVGPATRAIMVNFPHNPTGTTVTAEEQQRIVAIARRAGAYLVWDNAFAEITYDRPPLPDVSRAYERGLSIGTLSKSYGLPGLRVGWCLGPADMLRATIAVRDTTTLFMSPLVETIAAHAVRHRRRLRERHLPRLARNRALLLEWADQSPVVADCPPPLGGVTAFVRFAGIADTTPLCRRLASAGVLLVPGATFGDPGRVRLGFGAATGDLIAGLRKIVEVLASATHSAGGST
jgi:capreomycidine synthase